MVVFFMPPCWFSSQLFSLSRSFLIPPTNDRFTFLQPNYVVFFSLRFDLNVTGNVFQRIHSLTYTHTLTADSKTHEIERESDSFFFSLFLFIIWTPLSIQISVCLHLIYVWKKVWESETETCQQMNPIANWIYLSFYGVAQYSKELPQGRTISSTVSVHTQCITVVWSLDWIQ